MVRVIVGSQVLDEARLNTLLCITEEVVNSQQSPLRSHSSARTSTILTLVHLIIYQVLAILADGRTVK